MKHALAAFIVTASMASAAYAQPPATGFIELRDYVSIGDTVFVTDHEGRILEGKVQRISASELLLRHGADDIMVSDRDVQRITRRGHPVRNGALFGLAVGFAAGAVWAASQPCKITCFSSAGGVLAFGGSAGAIGLGVGAAIGAARPSEHVLFQQPASGATIGMRTPISTSNAASLKVAISW